MPIRPDSHVIADIAVSRVTSVLCDCGWACQNVEQDYGEDIFVQTKIGEIIDPHRLWLQVKGTRSIGKYERKDGRFSYPIPRKHVHKWINSPDLVIFVLYDVTGDRAFWALPSEQITLWDLYESENKSLLIKISPENIFNAESARRLCWEGRMNNFFARLSVAEHRQADVLRQRENTPTYCPEFKCKSPLIVYEFLKAVGFLTTDGVNEEFVRKFSRCKRRFRSDYPDQTDRQTVHNAAVLCFLGHVDRVAGIPVPELLLLQSLDVGLQLMALSHPDVYVIPD